MRKSIKRNLAYDDQKDLYYVTMHYGMRPDGSRDRCVRTFRCFLSHTPIAAEAAMPAAASTQSIIQVPMYDGERS